MRVLIKCFYILTAILFSCNQAKQLEREAYLKWVSDPENGLSVTKKIGGYSFIASYRPVDFMTLSEFSSGRENVNASVFDSLKKEFEGMHYFVLKIGTSDRANDMLSFGIENQQQYYNRVEYFSTTAQNDIYLIDGSDTTACGLYHFERTYGVSPYNSLILGFEKRKESALKNKQLHFNDQMLGNGMLIFSFPAEEINSIPQLKL